MLKSVAGRASGTYYERLEVPANANQVQLRQAYRNLSKRYHPDTTSLPPAEALERLNAVKRAYGVLIDPAARQRYDSQLVLLQRNPAPALDPARLSHSSGDGVEQPLDVRRSLSGGEWFALVLLGLSFLACLVLAIGLAWARGSDLVQRLGL